MQTACLAVWVICFLSVMGLWGWAFCLFGFWVVFGFFSPVKYYDAGAGIC